MRVYQDSKELPLFNFERIMETGDYFYLLKDYENSPEIKEKEAEKEQELKEKFNEIIKDYNLSINAKNGEILNIGSVELAKINLLKFSTLLDLIILKEKENELRKISELEEDWEDVDILLSQIKIRRSKDIDEQKKYISERIDMWRNNLEKAMKKQEAENDKKEANSNINDIIVNVEIILERSIDLHKTSLYRFGKLQEIAIKKIEMSK